jgi:RHS repeat-associated protein
MLLAVAVFGSVLSIAEGSASLAQATPGATSFTYDANGNRTSMLEGGVLWTYVYDTRDRLVEVRRDGTLIESYGYDFLDRRVVKRGVGGHTRYLWDDGSLLAELDGAGATVVRYEYGGRRLLSVDHAIEGRGFYLFDGARSPVGILGSDGILRARYSWDVWGELRRSVGDSASPFGFTGYQSDELTGLYYAGARYYDATLGLFLSEDPLLGDIETPASLHRYLFAYANPTVYWDPDGRESIRQLLDPEEDLMAGRLVRGAAKFLAYNYWNVFSLGFLGEHDEIYETSSGGDYAVGAALALGKTGAKAYVAAQTGGAGMAFSQAAGLGALSSGAIAGGMAGLAHTAADDLFRVAEGTPTHSAGDYAAATLGGAGGGALVSRLAAPLPARGPPPALNAEAVRARVLGNIAESQAARQAGRFGD